MRSALALCIGFLAFGDLCAQVVRVEEDWELRVGHPDEQIDAPQVQVTLFPFGEVVDVQLQVDVNHGSYPSFSHGGIQLLLWSGGECVASHRIHQGYRLQTPNEVVSWTTYVQKMESGFAFGIKSGASASFGSFGGGNDYVTASLGQIEQGTLNNYRFSQSVENSGIPFASNRVQHLRLKKLRIYQASGSATEVPVNLDVAKPAH